MINPSDSDETAGDVEAALITVRDWLRYATSQFNAAGLEFGHGTATALDEAAFLILHTLSLPIDRLDPWLDARLTHAERTSVHAIVKLRIATRKPAPYLTGVAYIQGYRFHVDERVIVPRSYLGELLCNGQLEAVLPAPPTSILDLCTGSGCLAIVAAHTFPDACVDAVDVSADALEVAARNVRDYCLDDRIELIQGDLFAPLQGRRYDLIISNPPYVATAEVDAFPPEYAAEPRLAHSGGDDGLALVHRILRQAHRHLAPGGTLVMEIGTGRALLERALPDLAPIWLDTQTSAGEVLVLRTEDLNVES